jgi:ketosteroid isomerase-like protein
VDAVEFIRDVTYKMCDRDSTWTWSSRRSRTTSSITGTARRRTGRATSPAAASTARFASIDRPQFDELFAVDDRVVVAYTLALHRRAGSTERMAVMATWTVADGKITVLREVDAPAAA